MAISSYPDFQTSGGGFGEGFTGYKKFGKTQLESSEDFLRLAMQQGGAVGQVAEELMHPERSILATVGQGFKKAFSGFIDTISLSSEVVAGIISPDRTIKQAIDEDLRVSDVFFGEPDKNASAMVKVGSFMTRLAVDVLTDPLTYISFGAGGIFFGAKAASKLGLTDELAKIIGLSSDDLVKVSAYAKKNPKEFSKLLKSSKDDLLSPLSAILGKTEKQVARKLTKEAGDITYLNKKALALIDKKIHYQRAGLTRAAELTGKKMGLEGADLARYINTTINAPLHRETAMKSMSSLLARHPALIETYIDKGGIKFFNQTLLSSQRIGSAMRAIPGFTIMDNATAKVRHTIGSLFDTSLTPNGRITPEAKQILEKWQDLATSQEKDVVNRIVKVWKDFKVTAQEDDIIRNCIEEKKFHGDPRIDTLIKTIKGIHKKNFKEMWRAGIHLTEIPNYVPHILVDEGATKTKYITTGSRNIKSAREAEIARFTSIETGEVFIGKKGAAVSLKDIEKKGLKEAERKDLTQKFREREVARITDTLDEIKNKLGIEGQQLTGDIEKLRTKILETFKYKSGVALEESLLKDLPSKSSQNAKHVLESIKNAIDDIDIETMATARAKETMQTGIKVEKIIADMSADALQSGRSKLSKDLAALGADIEHVNFLMDTAKPVIKVSTHKGGKAGEIKDVYKKIKEEYKEKSLKIIKEGEKRVKEIPKLKPDDIVPGLKTTLKQTEKAIKNDARALTRTETTIKKLKGDLKKTKDKDAIAKLKTKITDKEDSATRIYKAMTLKRGAVAKAQKIVPTTMKTKGLNKTQEARLISELRQQFENNPQGVKHILDTMLGKEQKITDVLADIELAKLSAKVEAENLPEAARFFVDKDGSTFERTRATIKDAEMIGVHFDKSAISTAVQSSSNVIKGTTLRHMVDEIATKFGVIEEKAATGFRPIAIKGLKEESVDFAKFMKGNKGENLYFHPHLADKVEDFLGVMMRDEATSNIMKAFDKVQGVWKASVTSVFPAFHGRNAISNVFLNFLDIGLESLNPTNHIMASSLLKKEHDAANLASQMIKPGAAGEIAKAKFWKLMDTEVLTDQTGSRYTFGELRRLISEKNVAFNPNIVGALDVRKPIKEVMHDLFPATTKAGKAWKVTKKVTPFTQEFLPFQVGRKFGNKIEEQSRLVNFLSHLRKTGDAQLAAQRTKQFLFDYQNLTNFEKAFMRRIIPFYTFTRKNLALQTQVLATTPGKVAAEVKFLTGLGDVISGEKLTQEQEDTLPDWIKSGIKILSDKKGSTVEMLGSLGTPIEQPFQAFQPNQFLGSISPLLRVPLEQASGYSFFQGKALSDVTNAAAFKHAPKALKQLIGYTEVEGKRSDGSDFTWYVSLRPERMNLLLNVPPFSRVFSALKQMQAVDVSAQSKILQQTIGIRPYSFDLEQEAAKRERELRQQIEKLLTDAGVTAQFKKTFIPKD